MKICLALFFLSACLLDVSHVTGLRRRAKMSNMWRQVRKKEGVGSYILRGRAGETPAPSSNNAPPLSSEAPGKKQADPTAEVCTKAGFFPIPGSGCKRFYRCVDFLQDGLHFWIFHFDCAPGTLFDVRISVCNHPNAVQCVDSADVVATTTRPDGMSDITIDTTSSISETGSTDQVTPFEDEIILTTESSSGDGDGSTDIVGLTTDAGQIDGETTTEVSLTTETGTAGNETTTEISPPTEAGPVDGESTDKVGLTTEASSGNETDSTDEMTVTTGASPTDVTDSPVGVSSTDASISTDEDTSTAELGLTDAASTTDAAGSADETTPVGTDSDIEDPTTSAPTPKPGSASGAFTITCHADNKYRVHPLFCNKYYYCIQNEEDWSIPIFTCPKDLIFDEVGQKCAKTVEGISSDCELAPYQPALPPGSISGAPDEESELQTTTPSEVEPSLEATTEVAPEPETTPELPAPTTSQPEKPEENPVTEPPTTQSPELSENAPDGVFDCPAVGHYPFEGDCVRFYKCVETVESKLLGLMYSCPEGYEYSETDVKCVEKGTLPPCERILQPEHENLETATPLVPKDLLWIFNN